MIQRARLVPMAVGLRLAGNFDGDRNRGAILGVHHLHLNEDDIGIGLVETQSDSQLGRLRAACYTDQTGDYNNR